MHHVNGGLCGRQLCGSLVAWWRLLTNQQAWSNLECNGFNNEIRRRIWRLSSDAKSSTRLAGVCGPHAFSDDCRSSSDLVGEY